MPTLAIDVKAQFAQVLDGLDKVNRQASKVGSTLETAFSGLKGLVGGLFAGISVGVLANEFKQTVSLMSSFKDGAEQAGTSVEKLSSLFFDLRESNIPVTELTDTTTKLVKAMQEAGDKSSGAAEAFKAIGVETRDSQGNMRDATDVLRDVAGAFAKYEDGANKVAIAQELLGKSGAAALPMLKDLAEVTERSAGLTKAQAEAADDFEKAMQRLSGQLERGRISLFSGLIEPLTELIRLFADAKDAGLSFLDTLDMFQAKASNAFRGLLGFKEIDFTGKLEEQLKGLKAELEVAEKATLGTGFDAGASWFGAATVDAEKLRKKIAEVQGQIDALRKTEQQASDRALAAGLQGFGDSSLSGGFVKPQAPKITGGGKKKTEKEKETEGQKLVEQYEKQSVAAAKLTAYEQAMLDITAALAKDKKSITELDERRIIAAAKLTDSIKEEEKLRKEAEDSRKAAEELDKFILEQDKRANEELEKKVQGYKDLADPVEEYRVKLREIIDLQRQGLLTQEEAGKASMAVSQQIDDLDKTRVKTEETKDEARELGLTFTSAAEDAIANWKGFRDLIGGIAADLRRLAFRKLITEPFLNAMANGFGATPMGGGAGTPQTGNLTGAGSGPGAGFVNVPSYGAMSSAAPVNNITLNGSGVTMHDVTRAVRAGQAETTGAMLDQPRRNGAYG